MVHKFNIINCIRITYVIYMLLDVLIPATAQPYMIKRLGVEDGISSNYVVGITQDQQGCMWIATEDGLNKFDGNHFTVYTKHTSGLTSNELNTVFPMKILSGLQLNATDYVHLTVIKKHLPPI